MARPRKDFLDYFPIDTSFFNDLKIKKLIRKFGGDGLMTYLFLVNQVYLTGFELTIENDEQLEIYADDLRMDFELFQNIFDSCFELKLFDAAAYKKQNILTSEGIKKRYNFIMQERLRKRKDSYGGNNSEELRNNYGEITEELGETPDSSATKERKEKKRK